MALATSLWAMLGFASAEQSIKSTNDRPKAVLELYTSQGCSSCPAADALFQSYAQRPDLVALTFAVDYWDYLGWKDTFASSQFSYRQRAYAKARGDGRIYTPQVVVNGAIHVVGSSAREIDLAIQSGEQRFKVAGVPLKVRHEGMQLVVEAGGAGGTDTKDVIIWLAMVQKEAVVPVERGENRGRTLKYYNIVRQLHQVGHWNGTATVLNLDKPANLQAGVESCAVLLQSGKGGPIVGAAFVPKW
jgi:hypothetical protein